MCRGLNADLNRVNLTECPKYIRYRIILFDKLRNFETLNVVKLFFGDFNLNVSDNKIILFSVQEYIKAT